MRRTLVIASVLVAALTAAVPGAGAAGPRRGFLFYLHAGGFAIQGRGGLGKHGIRLLLDRHGEVAYYYDGAKVGPGTVAARFGRLGELDLRFIPGAGEGALGCGGDEGRQRGSFRGTIEFRGEHDYADVDAHRARGWFQTRPRSDCADGPRRSGARSRAVASRIAPIAETGAELVASTGRRLPDRFLYFSTTNGEAGVRGDFSAFRAERREGMAIERGAQVVGGARAFAWNLGTGTARVEPPAPFSGRGVYRPGADGRPSWTGSLRAPVLGGSPIRLTGAAFQTYLGPTLGHLG
ncbi:MAG: hypothetical protein JSS97_09615 [Actinobacteria bacterium]|nr:hypothetical protein [Actinomycetota bacterium]